MSLFYYIYNYTAYIAGAERNLFKLPGLNSFSFCYYSDQNSTNTIDKF